MWVIIQTHSLRKSQFIPIQRSIEQARSLLESTISALISTPPSQSAQTQIYSIYVSPLQAIWPCFVNHP
ncbi:hypothetical protein FGO68_gene16905 [Halteria grandinella]|uniref:Uncharacterized protein n=1 Tax=Halteria grandinella TaxID=5974 RepID=A0A8J8NRY2_HALGN|nr:hypothetical protein FGO68_gene16905 [Halteria grandinella]